MAAAVVCVGPVSVGSTEDSSPAGADVLRAVGPPGAVESDVSVPADTAAEVVSKASSWLLLLWRMLGLTSAAVLDLAAAVDACWLWPAVSTVAVDRMVSLSKVVELRLDEKLRIVEVCGDVLGLMEVVVDSSMIEEDDSPGKSVLVSCSNDEVAKRMRFLR